MSISVYSPGCCYHGKVLKEELIGTGAEYYLKSAALTSLWDFRTCFHTGVRGASGSNMQATNVYQTKIAVSNKALRVGYAVDPPPSNSDYNR